MSDCGAQDLGNTLLAGLTAGENFTLPEVDLTSPIYNLPNMGDLDIAVPQISIDELTDGIVDGDGAFDKMMKAMSAHLDREFTKGRITGQQFSEVYIALQNTVMQNATQFVLGKPQAYWAAVNAQIQARRSRIEEVATRVQLEVAKAQLAAVRFDSQTSKANFALSKMRLSAESMNFCIAKYNLENILPVQRQLTLEQVETARAQTLDTRSDGTVVTGSVGKQKDLYNQQIISYQRDQETKFAKMLSDAWITQKSLDEGTLPPNIFTNLVIDQVMNVIRENMDLDNPAI